MRITRVYTKSGDGGKTRLGDGSLRDKDDVRIEAYGTIDELNAALGLAVFSASGDKTLLDLLTRVQNHLFDIGSDLCRPESVDKTKRFPEKRALWLEQQIDECNARLKPLENFILPAGSALSCHLHLARTLARRAERRVIALVAKEEGVSVGIRIYLNRLSDLLFVLARFHNERGEKDILWQPNED